MSKTAQKPELELARAKFEAERAKKELASTMAALRYQLKPGTLAHNAWEGVRGKSSEVADQGMLAVKERPVTASGVAAALLLFLARQPLMRFAGKLLGPRKDETVVTADLKHHDKDFDLTAPVVERSRHEGVSA